MAKAGPAEPAVSTRYAVLCCLCMLRQRSSYDADVVTGLGATRGVRARLGRLMWLKALGTTAFMAAFFVAYFHLLRDPAYPVHVMALTALDHWIAFQPQALFVYFSLWFYVALPPALLEQRHELAGYGAWVGALCVAGLLCFYFWPTAIPPNPIDASEHAGFALLRGVDAAGNACPSMHVATATFSAVWLDRLLRQMDLAPGWRVFNGLWLLGIVWSTVAVRQHVALDAGAGLLLGLAFALPSVGWHRRAMAV